MIQRIIDSIGKTLHDAYPDYPVLEDDLNQDVDRPAFYIRCVSAEPTDRITKAGFFLDMLYEVEYDPGESEPKYACYEMGAELIYLLKRIPDIEGGLDFRPYDVESRVVDNRLLFTFYINESVQYEEPDGTKIRDIDVKVRIKRSRNE